MSRIRPGKFKRLVQNGRVPERKVSQQEGQCAHVAVGKCEACATGARPYVKEHQLPIDPTALRRALGVSQ